MEKQNEEELCFWEHWKFSRYEECFTTRCCRLDALGRHILTPLQLMFDFLVTRIDTFLYILVTYTFT
jgi:hypothetical protein